MAGPEAGLVRGHAARWALLMGLALAAALAFPGTGVPAAAGRPPALHFIGALLYDAVLLAPFWALLAFYRRETYRSLRELTFVTVLFAVAIAAAALVVHWAPDRPELSPVPFVAMVVTMLWSGRLAVFAAVTLAVLIGAQWIFPDQAALIFGLTGGVAGALSIRMIRRRKSIYPTLALMVGAYVVTSLALGLTFAWTPSAMLVSAAWGVGVAVVSVAVAQLAMPLAESATHVTTDLTLLELSDPARPLLKRLALEAPGTYAHSIAMANLSEAAAEAVGANGLLARVGCYYHDIGKLARPQYFVENQPRATSPHDQLDPAESARIIREHVEAGLALAREHHLPDVLRAFIAEHHGTTKVEYFLDRARQGGVAPLDDRAFTYPGPRPSSAETAIAMLADSAEAAVRALADPTPDASRQAITRVVAARVAAHQLDDAPLTLHDLDRVQTEFARVLGGMYHDRVRYPVPPGEVAGEIPRIRGA
ncbi:MAG TPA: HDIG domain-containing protein [Gemmatimonadales bacterium]|nr:HDIG domain-containing protein [Gemmatimonadales bacterium]